MTTPSNTNARRTSFKHWASGFLNGMWYASGLGSGSNSIRILPRSGGRSHSAPTTRDESSETVGSPDSSDSESGGLKSPSRSARNLQGQDAESSVDSGVNAKSESPEPEENGANDDVVFIQEIPNRRKTQSSTKNETAESSAASPVTNGHGRRKPSSSSSDSKNKKPIKRRRRRTDCPETSESESSSDEDVETLDNKPSYCKCQNPRRDKLGWMIKCDNIICPYVWWHYMCVPLPEGRKVAGVWFCPECRATENNHQEKLPNKELQLKLKAFNDSSTARRDALRRTGYAL